MKKLSLIALAIVGIVLLPTIASAQTAGKPSYQSLLAKNYVLQTQINYLQAQLKTMQAANPPTRVSAPSRPRLYEFPVAPSTNSQPLIVPRLSNIPDSRVVLIGTNH